ncbi:hypothetical protein E2C01_016224 [Portunus trituberculatus]|uniref:Uncharacterized protein n=1 Tax=Portunus trituberculatus TaxID=210409 RepID=A0A5B7DPQ2_PORTR|nr:hypothetical protein [Portunus trituberculatus]
MPDNSSLKNLYLVSQDMWRKKNKFMTYHHDHGKNVNRNNTRHPMKDFPALAEISMKQFPLNRIQVKSFKLLIIRHVTKTHNLLSLMLLN